MAVVSSVYDLTVAIDIANAGPFGLKSSIFTRSLSAAHRFADESECGIVEVNQDSAGLEYHLPFDGTKASAYGPAEQGMAAESFYTRSTTVYLSHLPRSCRGDAAVAASDRPPDDDLRTGLQKAVASGAPAVVARQRSGSTAAQKPAGELEERPDGPRHDCDRQRGGNVV